MSDESRAGETPRADGYNAGYAEELYERSLRQRGIVPPSLADLVEDSESSTRATFGAPVAGVPDLPQATAAASPEQLRIAAASGSLVEARLRSRL